MIRIVLQAIINGSANPIALAKAGMDLTDLTAEQRAELRGEGTAASTVPGPGWEWWSGPSDEWYSHGPFATREEAVAALDGDAGYVTQAHPPAPIRLSAEQLLEDQYFENNDDFDFDHAEPDRRGDAAAIASADAELQILLDRWCDRAAHTFERGNLFGGTRNGEHVEASPAIVETDSTTASPCPASPADSTGGDQ
ncbi:hypothetical protein ACVOMT_03570 [Sphingomonas panni]